ncbi:MAG: hypothetical protein RR904_04190 [Bacilli bacterium]
MSKTLIYSDILKDEEENISIEELIEKISKLENELDNKNEEIESLKNQNQKLEFEKETIEDKYNENEEQKNYIVRKYERLQIELKIEKESLQKIKEKEEEKLIKLTEKETKLKIEEKEMEKQSRLLKSEIENNNKLLKEIQQKEVKLNNKEFEINNKEIEILNEKKSFESDMQKQLSDYKIEEIKNIEKYKSEEREKLQKELDNIRKAEITKIEELCKEKHKDADKELQKVSSEIELQKENLQKEKREVEIELDKVESIKLKNELDLKIIKKERKRLQIELDELEENKENFDEIIEEKYSEILASMRSDKEASGKELIRLREELKKEKDEKRALEKFGEIYENPQKYMEEVDFLNKKIRDLKEDLAQRPEKDIEEKYKDEKSNRDRLEIEYNELKTKHNQIEIKLQSLENIEAEKNQFEVKYINVNDHNQYLENICEQLNDKLKRLSSPEERLSDREQRLKEISGYSQEIINPDNSEFKSSKEVEELDEIEWLENILKQCSDYGIAFPRRILYAFHTALKIADWSTIAVLAGVSGTGKSELPRLYSAFGGFNFISTSVQPNWDSQESMLGFFNSIDNRFDAQPLLKYLVGCTENQEYNKYMSLVLLDEMNLAHVEYYFAEFLSKLESRRGRGKKGSEPTVEIKLGAGIDPYELRLARSILWVGTMNQDETTKSLSDKVLDRGLVINFPRPKKLSGRSKMGSIEKAIKDSGREMLRKEYWTKWVETSIKLEKVYLDRIDTYKDITQKINDALEIVGRALGHRVWQSIEYYIINYPTVRKSLKEANNELTNDVKKAMDTAFEDQIVQKIMPKLRGIETRGIGKKSLDEIQALLNEHGFENLKDDFEIAREQGYGQFIWNSAKYIENEDVVQNVEIDEVEVSATEEV